MCLSIVLTHFGIHKVEAHLLMAGYLNAGVDALGRLLVRPLSRLL